MLGPQVSFVIVAYSTLLGVIAVRLGVQCITTQVSNCDYTSHYMLVNWIRLYCRIVPGHGLFASWLQQYHIFLCFVEQTMHWEEWTELCAHQFSRRVMDNGCYPGIMEMSSFLHTGQMTIATLPKNLGMDKIVLGHFLIIAPHRIPIGIRIAYSSHISQGM